MFKFHWFEKIKLFGTIEVGFFTRCQGDNTLPNIRPINKIEICAFIKKKKIDIILTLKTFVYLYMHSLYSV